MKKGNLGHLPFFCQKSAKSIFFFDISLVSDRKGALKHFIRHGQNDIVKTPLNDITSYYTDSSSDPRPA